MVIVLFALGFLLLNLDIATSRAIKISTMPLAIKYSIAASDGITYYTASYDLIGEHTVTAPAYWIFNHVPKKWEHYQTTLLYTGDAHVDELKRILITKIIEEE